VCNTITSIVRFNWASKSQTLILTTPGWGTPTTSTSGKEAVSPRGNIADPVPEHPTIWNSIPWLTEWKKECGYLPEVEDRPCSPDVLPSWRRAGDNGKALGPASLALVGSHSETSAMASASVAATALATQSRMGGTELACWLKNTPKGRWVDDSYTVNSSTRYWYSASLTISP